MTSIAIDFGSARTKVATFDNTVHRAVIVELGREIRSVIPSVAYVPPEGLILFGDDAQLEGMRDPQGLVHDLKRQIHRSGDVLRNGRRTSYSTLVAAFLRQIYDDCQRLLCPGGSISGCVLTVPLGFDVLQRRLFRTAATEAGLDNVTEIDETIAAARGWLRENRTASNCIAVCDIGGANTSIALLRLESGSVRFHSDVPPHRRDRGIDAIDYELWDLIEKESGGNLSESVPQGLGHQLRQLKESFSRFNRAEGRLLLRDRSLVVKREIIQQCWDAFTIQINEQLSALCQQLGLLGVKDTPLLLIGGGANVPGLGTTIETTGWPGPVLQSPRADFAVVLGAVDPPRVSGPGRRSAGGPPLYDPNAPA